MQIDHAKVKGLGGRIRTVGQDAESYLRSISGTLDQGARGNTGFGAVAMLAQTLQRLGDQTSRLASSCQTTGDNIGTAAANHAATDSAQRDVFGSYNNALGGRH